MADVTIYGIKNCGTMKKAFDWLDDRGIAYDFHDYKKLGADADILRMAFERHGWENVLNRKGMSWRKLPDDVKNTMDADTAFAVAIDNPSIIRRPMMMKDGRIHLGFDEDEYRATFASE